MRRKQAHPKKVSSKYRLYSTSAMTNAFKAMKEKKVSVKMAARIFDVPESTLRQRALGRVNPETTSSGPSPILSQEEEALLVEHLEHMASLGYGYIRTDIVDMASEYAVSLNKRDRDHPFTFKWLRTFMRRWPELNVSKPRSLSTFRNKATSKEVVEKYFQELNNILTKYNIADKPHLIYKVDEKGLQTELTPASVAEYKDPSSLAITSDRSSLTTVIGCGNAVGTQLPPYFVFQGQQMTQELLAGCTPGSDGTVTKSGCPNGEVFSNYLDGHFLQKIQRDPDQNILLLYDEQKSHISVHLIDWAKEHNVILFVLPAHTSHVLQPVDFDPFQQIYDSECHKFIKRNPSSSKISMFNVCELACKAYTHSLSVENLKSTFKRTGVYPYDPSAADPTSLDPDNASSAASSDCEDQDRSSVDHTEGKKVTSNTNSKKKARRGKVVQTEKQPGTLQNHIQAQSNNIMDSNDSEMTMEKCCVCKQFQPKEVEECVSLVFTKWAQCDVNGCNHWTHLEFCCPQRVVRLKDEFTCPCHHHI